MKLNIITDYTTTATASTTTAAESAAESTTTNYDEGKDSDEITTETTKSEDSGEKDKEKSNNKDDIYVEFRVKAEQNAQIVLAPCKDCDGIEIVLGFRGDTVSVMRQKKKTPTVEVDQAVRFIHSNHLE